MHLNDDHNDVDYDADDSEYDNDSDDNLMVRKAHVHIIFVWCCICDASQRLLNMRSQRFIR